MKSLFATRTAFVAALVLLVGLIALAVGSVGPDRAEAVHSPANCFSSALFLETARLPGAGEQGDTIEYRVVVRNNVLDDTGPCDIADADIRFAEPAVNGTPTGTVYDLILMHDLPADGSGDLCFRSSTSPFTCPAGTTPVINEALSYVINVNAGTNFAVAGAAITGPRAATALCPSGAARLLDSDSESDACDAKTATITIVDARINITPNGTNEVNDAHTFTCHIDVDNGPNGFVNAPAGTLCNVTITNGGPGTITGSPCATVGATGSCTVTDNSAVSGIDEVQACTDVTVLNVQMTRCTTNLSPDPTVQSCQPSDTPTVIPNNAVKCWVNAKISLSPPTDTNEVNDTHVITCTIQVNPTSGFVNAPDGTVCDADISGVGSFVGNDDDCTVDGGDGNCTLTITSAVSGTSTISACTEEAAPPNGLSVLGVLLTRCTDGATVEVGHANGNPVTKLWVNAKITLSPPTDTNEVNDTHVITCTIEVNAGAGFVLAPNGTNCDADISGVGSFVGDVDSCLVDGGDGNCTVTITSAVSGTSTVSACTEEATPPNGLNVAGVLLSRCTDGTVVEVGHSNGLPVTKVWVNAKISLSPPTDTNEVNDTHVITCTIQVNAGVGFVNAPDGAVCDADITGVGSFVAGDDDCVIDGGDGNCTLSITSAVSGTSTISACTEESTPPNGLNVGGVLLSRCTDGALVEVGHSNGSPVTKVWVNAKISLSPPTDTNEINDTHVITCTVQVNLGAGAGFVNAPDGTLCDADITGVGSFVAGDDDCVVDGGDGNCTLSITSAVSGTSTVSACTEESTPPDGLTVAGVLLSRCTDGAVVEIGHSNGNPVTKVWVNAKISLSPPTDTNEVNDTHVITCTIQVNAGVGFVNAPDGAVCDADITGVGSFVAGDDDCLVDGGDGNCTLSITSAVSGTSTVSACTEESAPPNGLNVGGLLLSRCTDGALVEVGHSNGNPVTKVWVNAKISLSPPSDTNEVNDTHVITCTVEVNAGAGFVLAPNGTVCDADISGVGSFVLGDDDCVVDGGDGNCTLSITSAVSGTSTVSACTEESTPPNGLNVGGVLLSRCTDGAVVEVGHSNGLPVTKVWVNAKISLTPATATNPVNTTHDITCTIQINPGTGFVNAPDGTICDAAIDSGVGSFVGGVDTCAVNGGDGNCIVVITSAVAGTTNVSACTSGLVVSTVALLRCTDGAVVEIGHANGLPVEKHWIAPGECFVLWDEEALDNDFRTVEQAAAALGITPDRLINDDKPKEKVASASDWVLRWSELRASSALQPGDPGFAQRFEARIPTGQDMDEGWYVLPEQIRYVDGRTNRWTDGSGNVINEAAWFDALINGQLEQSELDKIADVQPLRDRDLATLTGKTCTALVWDSDISLNYRPRNGNLQGGKLGVLTFTILDMIVPQSTAPDGTPRIPESTSSTSFFDVKIRIEPPQFKAGGVPVNQSQETDSVQTTRTRCSNSTLDVRAKTSKPNAQLYIAVESLITEESLTLMTGTGGGNFVYTQAGVNCTALRNKVVTIYSDNGASPLAPTAFGSGGTYNDRIRN